MYVRRSSCIFYKWNEGSIWHNFHIIFIWVLIAMNNSSNQRIWSTYNLLKHFKITIPQYHMKSGMNHLPYVTTQTNDGWLIFTTRLLLSILFSNLLNIEPIATSRFENRITNSVSWKRYRKSNFMKNKFRKKLTWKIMYFKISCHRKNRTWKINTNHILLLVKEC